MIRSVLAVALATGALLGAPLAIPAVIPMAAAADVCAAFAGTVQADGLCRVHVDDPKYTLDMTFPVDFPDQAAVTDFLTQTRDGFVNVAQTPDSGSVPYALDVKGSLWSSDNHRSVVFEVYQDLGGAHPSTWYESFNYDLARKRAITFDDLFAPGTAPLNAIFPIVQAKLVAEIGDPDVVSVSDGMDPSHYRNFAITPVDLVFFFDRGELMAGAAGAHTVYVPRSAIAPLAI
jgi:Protein of unknown function (DUF3298)